MKIEELKEGQKILVECEFDSLAGGNQAWVLIQEEGELVQLDSIKLDQPKPVVPQFVADWIEICDMRFVNLNYIFGENCPEKVKEWASVYGNHKKMLQALLYGYTVEKEKLYTVVIPNPHEKQLSYVLMRQPNGNVIINVVHSSNLDLLKTDNDLQLTEEEIRKDFDWAWQWKKEMTE